MNCFYFGSIHISAFSGPEEESGETQRIARKSGRQGPACVHTEAAPGPKDAPDSRFFWFQLSADSKPDHRGCRDGW